MTRLLIDYAPSDAVIARGLASTVLGSVTSGLVHAAALPVLVVPERRSVLEPATDRRDDATA